jgi:hypothetical protein
VIINALGTVLIVFVHLMGLRPRKIWLGFAKAGEVWRLLARHIAASLDEDSQFWRGLNRGEQALSAWAVMALMI